MATVREGTIPFHGYHTWYQIVGDGETDDKLPLLVLHGGPGVPHDYLEPIGQLANNGRRVIFYDQLGCGNSDHVHNPKMWTVELFVAEVDAIRTALGLEKVHILGQSWGGMLAMQYALTYPAGVASLTISNSPASISLWLSEANRLRRELPQPVQDALIRHETAGTTDAPEYLEAMQVFYDRHVVRTQPMPEYVQRAFTKLAEYNEVYMTMNGPSEFHVIGTIKDWDITDRLKDIAYPTLLLSGRYDEATPAVVQVLKDNIPGAEWTIFEESSHMPFAEETERYLTTVESFLTRIEQGGN